MPRRPSHPELLAALAQVEGGGNPVARTLLALALVVESVRMVPPGLQCGGGMYQMTDGRSSPPSVIASTIMRWWRMAPGTPRAPLLVQQPLHACAAEPRDRIDGGLTRSRHRPALPFVVGRPPARQKQDLAAVIHLWAGAGRDFAARAFA